MNRNQPLLKYYLILMFKSKYGTIHVMLKTILMVLIHVGSKLKAVQELDNYATSYSDFFVLEFFLVLAREIYVIEYII